MAAAADVDLARVPAAVERRHGYPNRILDGAVGLDASVEPDAADWRRAIVVAASATQRYERYRAKHCRAELNVSQVPT